MILINPSVQRLRNGKRNAKEYPYWKDLVSLLGSEVVQLGITGDEPLVDKCFLNLSFEEIKKLLLASDYWISTDSFMPHLAYHIHKPGVVIWGPSDPKIYGYKENLNILKSRDCLRPDQFGIWESVEYDINRYEPADIVFSKIKDWYNELETTINGRRQ